MAKSITGDGMANNNSSKNGNSSRWPLVLAIISLLAFHWLNIELVDGVVVDGKRKGPSALANQSHEEEMIDGYNLKTCGIADPDMTKSDFVNSAREGQFPWLVSFQIVKPDGSHNHFCMGSFISDRWILSAAHCFADPALKPFIESRSIHLTGGSTNVHSPKNANFTISRIFYHSKFDRNSPIGFDVALVEVEQKAPLKLKYEGKLPFINTVCLPIEGKEYSEGQVVKLAGWGDTESKDPKSKPEHLLTTDLILTNGEQCAKIFSQKLKKVQDQYHSYKDFICADYHGERDACQGKFVGLNLLKRT